MVLITSPVAGSCTSNVRPEMAGLHSPPMNNPSGTDSSNAFSDASDIDNLPGSPSCSSSRALLCGLSDRSGLVPGHARILLLSVTGELGFPYAIHLARQ